MQGTYLCVCVCVCVFVCVCVCAGESEARLKGVFAAARHLAPAIIFFDEIDAVRAPTTARHRPPFHVPAPSPILLSLRHRLRVLTHLYWIWVAQGSNLYM